MNPFMMARRQRRPEEDALLAIEEGWGGVDVPSDTPVLRLDLLEEQREAEQAPRTVQVPLPSFDEYEARQARNRDVDDFNARAQEMAARQMVGAITRTPIPEAVSPLGTHAADLATRRRQEKAEALRELEAQDRLTRSRAYEASVEGALGRDASKTGRLQTAQELEREKLAESRRGAMAREEIARAGLALKGRPKAAKPEKATGRPGGKQLPPTAVSGLAGYGTAVAEIDSLADTFQRLGMSTAGARMGEMVTDVFDLRGTDAAEYKAAALRAMQAAGTILEGGKLAAGDEMKYRKMLPRPGDSAEVLKQKVDGLKSFLRDLVVRQGSAYRQAGYDVPEALVPTGSELVSGRVGASEGAPADEVTLVDDEGTEYVLPASRVEAILKARPNLRRK